MVVYLVGLGGSLEGRVAGVVLVLVGCREEIAGQLCCSCGACVHNLRWCSCSAHIPLNFRRSFSLVEPQYRNKDRERENVQAARVVASELMPYAMTRPVIETALAPLSLSKKCILRARARASHRVESAES